MYRYHCPDLEQLAHQLEMSPRRLRRSQLDGIEKLLTMVKPKGSYPYELVCYHITGYRRPQSIDGQQHGAVTGSHLISDLVTMAEQLSRRCGLRIDELVQPFQSQDEVSKALNVSTKTIRRWRPRGLTGIRVNFEDGVNRLVFCKGTVDRFVTQNPRLVHRGASFNQLTPDEKEGLVERARELLDARRMKLHAIAKILSEETGRAVETIRYTLRAYDRANPHEALFDPAGHPLFSARQRAVLNAHQAGWSVEAIAKGQGLKPETVQAILREIRARELKERPVSYIDNELFSAPNADALILETPRPTGNDAPAPSRRIPADLPAYLRTLYTVPLLSREQEQDIFRRYNYIKFKMARLVEALDVSECTDADIGAVDILDRQATELKNEIISANLRLVVSIAKKHVGKTGNFFEIVSDGNLSLMRAIENFDYARGNKFSTYASWAIMKNYARTIPEEHYHVTRFATGQDERIDASADTRETETEEMDTQHIRALLAEVFVELDERERKVVTHHFGLLGEGSAMTLDELGQQFGVTKERVRQIEVRAMNKLRASLGSRLSDILAS